MGAMGRLLAGFVGFAVGMLIATFSLWPEFFRRLDHARGGGGGETADWGQPMFYILITGFVPGLLGAALCIILATWLGPKQSSSQDGET